MTDKQTRIQVLRRQISQYFSHMNPPQEETIIYAESKMNREEPIVEEEPEYSKIKTQEELDQKIAQHKEKKEKKNYFGNRHLVPPKVSKKKTDAPVLSKLSQKETMEILRKDRSHPLWAKEIYKWSTKDWESLFKLRDEK
jgi:hypothetical protein